MAALKYAWRISRGRRGTIFGAVVLVVLPGILLLALLIPLLVQSPSPMLALLVGGMVGLILLAVVSGAIAYLYHRLSPIQRFAIPAFDQAGGPDNERGGYPLPPPRL